MLLPLEILLNTSERKTITDYTKFNYFQMLSRQSYFLYITDTINTLLVICSGICLVALYHSPQRYQKPSLPILFQIASFIIYMIGRFLFTYFGSLNILSFRCYFYDNACYEQTSIMRLVSNGIGLLIQILFSLYFYQYQTLCFPQLKVPLS